MEHMEHKHTAACVGHPITNALMAAAEVECAPAVTDTPVGAADGEPMEAPEANPAHVELCTEVDAFMTRVADEYDEQAARLGRIESMLVELLAIARK